MWSLWPQLIACFHEWALDYFENLLVTLDNFISRGTAHFLAGTSPNYLQQARRLACCWQHTAVVCVLPQSRLQATAAASQQMLPWRWCFPSQWRRWCPGRRPGPRAPAA